jgi:hypothetical protein
VSTFEDHLWSQLVSDHGEQIRQAEKETATLAASLRESSGRRRWRASGRRPSRRQLVLAGTTLGVACLASAIIVAAHTTNNPTAPAINRTAFAVTNNHDGTLTVTLHKRSALPALNASLVSYGLKAKLPADRSARTLSLTATCPKPTFPVKAAPGSGQNRVIHPPAVAVPSQPQRLKNCLLHATTS